jgi:hypothetical protein
LIVKAQNFDKTLYVREGQMKVSETRLSTSTISLLCLFFFSVVLYGQNAYAVAYAETAAYFDWNSFTVAGPKTLTYSGTGFSDLDQTFGAGYSTPNNATQLSPDWHGAKNWGNDTNGNRANPAGTVYGESIAQTPISNVYLPYAKNGSGQVTYQGPSVDPTNTNQGLFANAFARSDGMSYNDIEVEQYTGISHSYRQGEFTINASQTGTYTFSIDYYLLQHINIQDYTHDIATTTSSLYILLGSGTNYDLANADWDTYREFSNTLAYDAPPINYEPYDQTFTAHDTLTFTVNLATAGTYYFWAQVDNDARAGSAGLQTDPPEPPQPTPEPATIFLLGSGLIGAAFSRRSAAKSI